MRTAFSRYLSIEARLTRDTVVSPSVRLARAVESSIGSQRTRRPGPQRSRRMSANGPPPHLSATAPAGSGAHRQSSAVHRAARHGSTGGLAGEILDLSHVISRRRDRRAPRIQGCSEVPGRALPPGCAADERAGHTCTEDKRDQRDHPLRAVHLRRQLPTEDARDQTSSHDAKVHRGDQNDNTEQKYVGGDDVDDADEVSMWQHQHQSAQKE